MSKALAGLEPQALWRHFEMICGIPRCSGHEQRIQAALEALGKERGLETRRDKAGNLVLAVPATPGCEKSRVVVLQGHVDMVCEKNGDVAHDFATQGIQPYLDGEWVRARGTTLGADNGVAVAAALALLDDPPGRHGPLELLFTVDEERGLSGAAGIEPHMLAGRLLLNLDSEEEGFVTVGCAGGGDTAFELSGERTPVPAGWSLARLEVKGLRGGHSGIDILENRANSLRCLGRLLAALEGPMRVVSLKGGSMRNAIPREAEATLALPAGGAERAARAARALLAELQAEFGATDPELKLLVGAPEPGAPAGAFSETFSQKLATLLVSTPTGVLAMSRDIPGLVETSTNLGVAAMAGDTIRFVNCTRSSVKSSLEAARLGLRRLAEAVGAKVVQEQPYPGWKPDLASPLLALFKKVHQEAMGREVQVMAIHAGLECGILGERFPGMDMISFGPDLKAVHSPDERLHIPSTGRFFNLLKRLLEALA